MDLSPASALPASTALDHGRAPSNGSLPVAIEIRRADGRGPFGINPFSFILDMAEKACLKALYPYDHSENPLYFLHSNFGPVPESPPQSSLPVIGHLPSCLNGEFMRIGPNPKFKPVGGYHWFDGDGMIHALRIKDGNATYACRLVQTSKLNEEQYYGASKFVKLGDMKGVFGILMAQLFNLRTLFKVIDVSQGTGTGNTAMVYHDGRLLALHEGDKPYVIKLMEDGDLETLGFLDYEKRLTHSFTAHPKLDPITGELFMFGYQFKAPYCTYRVISKDGVMDDAVPITVSGPLMMHDFAITEHYAIFMDLPLYAQPEAMAKGQYFFTFDQSKPARFGVLPRYAKNESTIRWFELPGCFIFHNVNAWEDGDEVVLYTCRHQNFNLEVFSGPIEGRRFELEPRLYEMRFNLKTGKASQKQLSLFGVEFPRVNEKFIGRKQQFAYCTMVEPSARLIGLAKFNLWAEPELEGKTGSNVEGVILFGTRRYGSEAVFVPRLPEGNESEDDGYLICFVHDEATEASEVHVYNAKTMSSEPVAVVKLPARVPYGFHALFVNEEKLQSQR